MQCKLWDVCLVQVTLTLASLTWAALIGWVAQLA